MRFGKLKNDSAINLDGILRLEQAIHNLRMRVPIGIISIDNEMDNKRKRLEQLLQEKLQKGVTN